MQYVDVQDHMHESYTSHLGTKKRVASFGIFCIEYNHYDHLHFLQGARKRRQGFTAEFKNMFLWVIETNPIVFSPICYDALREFALVEMMCPYQQKTNSKSLVLPFVPVALVWTAFNADVLIQLC